MERKKIPKSEIIKYYDICEIAYKLVWDLGKSRAMHSGYWDETVKNLSQALERENEIVAEKARIKKTDVVLDAGCGVGGSSIFLARKFGCKVIGITLSEKQVNTAVNNAKLSGVDSLTEFFKMDFEEMDFKDESFDVVWAIESICHAHDKRKFIKEAYRVLKPGGRIVIADGFATKEHYSDKEQKVMESWLNGWGVSFLETSENFEIFLKESGFKEVSFSDVTEHVMPSSKRLYYYSLPGIFIGKIAEFFHICSEISIKSIIAAYFQYKALKSRLWKYGIFYAEKP